MNLYLWRSVGNVTGNWHDGGGIVVVAPSLEDAREQLSREAPKNCEALTTEPDAVYALANDELQQVTLFPDTGCC